MEYCKVPHSSGTLILRDFEEHDIEPYVEYWFGPSGLSVRGHMDMTAMGTADELRTRLKGRIEARRGNHKLSLTDQSFQIIVSRESATPGPSPMLGYGLIKDFTEDGTAGAHVHLIHAEDRVKGIASTVFWTALKVFFDRYPIRRILFEPPASNLASNGLLKHMGIRFVGTRFGKASAAVKPAELNCYEVTRTELEEKNQHSIAQH